MSDSTVLFTTIVLLPSVAGTPTNVTATRIGYNSVLVSWTAPLRLPAGYEVFHQTTSDTDRLSVGNTTGTMMTVTGLTLGVKYYIFVVSFGAERAPVLPSTHSNPPAIVTLQWLKNCELHTKYNIVHITILVTILYASKYTTTEWYTSTHSTYHLHQCIMDPYTISSRELHCLQLLSALM